MAYSHAALFALEYALAQLWKSWGVQPGVVMGHSIGEYAAACVAGVMSLQDGLTLVAERVRLIGRRPQEELTRWYAASDVVALASDNEGCPNVILESLACGTPVAASAVGGVPDEDLPATTPGVSATRRLGQAHSERCFLTYP